ncbi:MAG: hypothetical protein QW069_03930 [Candidatus Caldarchaeum sp.]
MTWIKEYEAILRPLLNMSLSCSVTVIPNILSCRSGKRFTTTFYT